ncbi:MAG: DUF2442 domain-containing protein [Isosphaeraceae bacterium]
MTTSHNEKPSLLAKHVSFTETSLTIELRDGTEVTRPLAWYPRPAYGNTVERNHWRLIADGYGVHWPDLDEDLCVEDVLAGRPSAESPRSFERWLKSHPVPQT